MREYTVLEPPREEFRQRVADAAFNKTHLPVTVRERLDELSSRRGQAARTMSFTVELVSIHLNDGGYVIVKIAETSVMARIDSDADTVTLTTGDMDDESMDTYPVT